MATRARSCPFGTMEMEESIGVEESSDLHRRRMTAALRQRRTHGNDAVDDAEAAQRADVLRRLYTATVLCSFFIVVEVTGGLLSHSLAVLSDAAHLCSDLASFAVASE